MENLNGALGFKATLDIDDFNVSAQAMERHIRQVSTATVSEAAQMDQSIQQFAQNGARYIVSYLVGQGMSSLLQSIVQTRGEFQQLEIAFGTMLKSDSKAKQLMDELVVTAAKTPFDLQGIANSAKQMMAYGSTVDTVVDELVMLGNVASGVGAPLGEIAYLYGTLRTQGRAYAMDIRQFAGRGIPIYEELAKILGVNKDQVAALVTEGKVGFAEVEKVFQNLTNSTGMYYNLMEKQSKSLTGMISNLEDAWDGVLNKLGSDNQDLFAGAISGATYLVEHFEDILRIVKAITIAYGSYKAAIVLNTLVTKGYTGVAILDNTARQAKIALMKLDANLTGQTARQTQLMTAAEKAHTAALQQKLTAEEQANLVKKLRIATIQQLLTAQQQEYLSNLNLTASSANYEAVAMGVLTVEQREALSKTDLSAKSAIYRAALAQEVAAKTQNQVATLNSMRVDVKAAHVKMESAKQSAIASMQATEAARYEVYWAKQSGNATKIAAAEKKLKAAQDNQALARKAALAAQSDFYAKKKALEAAATRQSTVATAADTTAKAANAAGTSVLTAITTKATLAMKALWTSMMSNPIGWILGLVGALVSVLTLFKSKEEEATDAMGEFQDTTRKEIDNLELLFAVLQNSDRGTKTHKDTIEKVNAVCKEYNKTLLDENATLAEQKAKYEELTTAIQNATAEKIRAKYAEQALQKANEERNKALKELKENAEEASYYSHTTYSPTTGGSYSTYIDSKNIQNASAAVWDAVEAEAIQSANDLKELSGEAYTQAFNQALSRITGLVQTATGATNKEMNAFNSSLKTYLTDVVNSSKTAQDEINKVNQQLSAFFAPQDTTPVTQSVDYVSMSFEELDKKAKEYQTEIDTINAKKVKVDTDTSKLTELLSLLGQINTAIDTKTSNLNTEAGINARIKQLKDERSNVEINSARYKELTKDIQTLEGKLPKTTGGDGADNIANARKELSQKQLEADRKLEEDRIAVMDEGYAKRKATLDLQHKLNLAQIDKEEKELAEARKKAGKGGLSATEKAGFQERRNLEDQSYEKANTDLFDEEISYRKEQYQLYFRWVKAMGADVANKQFKDLLKGGASYSEWINQEIAKLEQKKAQDPGSFTAGDQENLFSLTIQRDEINGVRSAMDLFNESVSQSVGQAATLAAKIEAIAKAKEELANGKFKLGADETLTAQNQLDTMEREAQQELNQTILNDYRSFEEQKKSIQDEYALLKQQAIKQGNDEVLRQLQQGENEALSALNASFLMQSESWKNLFSDLDALTVEQIDSLIKEIQEKMNTADLNLNPADLEAVLNQLDQAKQKIIDVNPFKALGRALNDVFKKQKDGSKKSSKQIKTDWSNLSKATEGCFDFVNDAISSCDVLGDLLGDNGKATIDMLQGVAMAGIAMASAIATAEKGSVILAAISIALQAIQWIASLFNNDDELEERIQNIQRNVDALANSFDRLQHAFDKTFWVYNDEEKEAHEKNLQAIEQEIAALEVQRNVALQTWNLIDYANLTKQIEDLQAALEKEQTNGDMFQLLEMQKNNLREQQELIKQQINAEKSKKDADDDKIADWEEQIEDIDQQIEDMEYDMLQTLAGTDIKSAIDEFADALVDAYCQGEDAAEALGEKTKDVLKKAVVDALKRQFLAKAINDAVLYLGEAMEDGILTDEEKQNFEDMVNAAGESFNAALEAVGDWIKDPEETEDPLTGAITSMSEETGGVVAGRLNAVVINQSDQLAIMRNQLVYQAEIAANTRISAERLGNIESTLKRIETKDSSLLSQGIS